MSQQMIGMGAADYTDAQTQADAIAMNNALAAHGYKISDQPLYRAFQSDAGLTADGFPGTNTMHELQAVLFALHVDMAPVPIYPWKSSGGYDGVNAPTAAQWGVSSGTVIPATSNTSVSTSSTTNSLTSMASMIPAWGWWTLAAAGVIGVAMVVEKNKGPIAHHARKATHGMHHHARRVMRRGRVRRK